MWTDSAMEPHGPRSIHRGSLVLTALTLTLLAALPALTGPFLYEDTHYTSLPVSFALTPRVLLNLTLAGSTSPFLQHLINLSLHVTCAGLFYLVASRWMRSWAAFVMSLVFLWHPLQAEAVYYIAGRGDLLAGIGVLGAVLAYQRIESEKLAIAVITLCGLCAMAAKDVSALGLIGLIPLCGWLKPHLNADRRVWVPSLIWGLSVALLVPFRVQLAPVSWMLAQTGQAWHLIRLMVFPIGQSIEAPVLPMWQGACGAIATVGMVLAVLTDWRRWPHVAFGVLWLFAAFLPRLVLDQLTLYPEPLHEHHAYVPLIGLLLSIGGAL